jgi:uncharacterized protein YaaW (UPF0174 family)
MRGDFNMKKEEQSLIESMASVSAKNIEKEIGNTEIETNLLQKMVLNEAKKITERFQKLDLLGTKFVSTAITKYLPKIMGEKLLG